MLLGFVPAEEPIRTYNAGLGTANKDGELDWLFE